MFGVAFAFEISREGEFGDDAGDEDDDGGDIVIDWFWVEETLDGFDDNVNADADNDESDDDGGDAFDFGAMVREGFDVGEFFAGDDEDTGNRVD